MLLVVIHKWQHGGWKWSLCDPTNTSKVIFQVTVINHQCFWFQPQIIGSNWINISLLILCLISYNVLYDMVQVWQVSFKSERNVLCQRHFLSHNRLPQNKSFCFKGANVLLNAWSYCLCIGLEKYTLLFYLGLGKFPTVYCLEKGIKRGSKCSKKVSGALESLQRN